MQLKRMTNSKLFYSVFLSIFFLCFASSSSLNSNHKCSEKQSDALLLFKQSLSSINFSIDDISLSRKCEYSLGSGYYPIMMNWSINTDCCNWDGITCDNFTGDVVGIDLSCGMLLGTIHPNSTIFHLPHLHTLNLAFNVFEGSQIPREIHRFSNSLTHLNISGCRLEGQIPSEILYLPRLISLDLSSNWGLNIQPTVFNSLLQNSTRLRELSFGEVNISSALPTNVSSSLRTLDLRATSLQGKLPNYIFNLPYLEKLDLSSNSLTGLLPKVNQSTNTRLKWLCLSGLSLSGGGLMFDSISHLKSLNHLDLSSTGLSRKIFDTIGNLKFLHYLDLSSNNLSGKIPDSFANFKSLNHLSLSYCNLMGSLPKSLLNLQDLTTLNLISNKLNGTLPSWLFTLPSLENIFLDDNMFSGVLPSELFNHSSLKQLTLSYNQFDGEINQVPIRLINLTTLYLSYNNFTGLLDLNTLLSSLSSLEELDLSYSGLSVVTNNATSYVNLDFRTLGLASCKLTMIPKSLQSMKNLEYLDLSSNDIKGRIPDWAGEIGENRLFQLNLSHNFITSLPHFQQYRLIWLSLQYNQIEGEFPTSICNMINMQFLDMSYNRFVGVIPQCFVTNLYNLMVVNMGNNRFHGTIPNVNRDSIRLIGLILNGNNLEGDVPSFLSKAQDLRVLDIGNNHLNGTFPTWLGDLPWLKILVLRSNNLHGSIETYFKSKLPFPSLQVLDLSHNGLVGHLPQKYFQNFIAMKDVVAKGPEPEYLALTTGLGSGYYYSVTIAVKGQQLSFPKLLLNYTIVDLSNNNFEGEIPDVIGTLNSLKVLNLSHNHLNGRIPHALGNLSAIESLDLSCNQLNGEIPQELADINSLGALNLSKNHLVGRIPKGKQFNTFEENSFGGNTGLCGFPLHRLCEQSSSPEIQDDDVDDEESGFIWKVVMLGYGCGALIGMVMGYLMLSTRKPNWFNAMVDAVEHTILKRQNRRRYIYIGK